MLVIKALRFRNMFAFADKVQEIDLSADVLTQLEGKNGAGKSSIHLILEELLFNKNSKGLKKDEISNFNTDSKGYWGQVDFNVGNDEYQLTVERKSTAKIVLLKNAKDISSHKSLDTYKELHKIIKLDHASFVKLVNQSMISSLDFLTATDAKRKSFLIGMLGLEEYVEYEVEFKETLSDIKAELATTKALEDSLLRRSKSIKVPEYEELRALPETPDFDGMRNDVAELNVKIKQSSDNNRRVNDVLRANSIYEKHMENPVVRVDFEDGAGLMLIKDCVSEYERDYTEAKTLFTVVSNEVKQLQDVKTSCHACGTKLDTSKSQSLLRKKLEEKRARHTEALSIHTKLQEYRVDLDSLLADKLAADGYDKWVIKTNGFLAATDFNITRADLTDVELERGRLKQIQTDLISKTKLVDASNEENNRIREANASITVLEQLRTDVKMELSEVVKNKHKLERSYKVYEILVKSFGSKGLVAYKIESQIKQLEKEINRYLSSITKGRFQLHFNLQDSKLAIDIKNSEQTVSVKSLSSGELNNVNTATLLAIRAMMTKVNKVSLNVLFLDEVVAVLDEESKERLVELLLEERNLNTFLVLHGYSHPLVTKLTVSKEKGMSYINYGE